MLTYRLPYKLLAMFLISSFILTVAFSLVTYQNSREMTEDIKSLAPLTPEQKDLQNRFLDDTIENLIALSFYIFILTFILSLFFSRRFLMPVKKLHRGAMSVKNGNLDTRLDVTPGDELSAVTKAFNDMADALRKKTNELKRKELYVSTMLDPLWVVDEDNIIADINPAFTRLFGYGRDEIIGSSIFDFLDEEAEKTMRRQLQERQKGTSATYEVSIISKTEGLIPVLISGAPIIEKGEVIGKIGIIKDFRQEAALRDALKDEKERTETIMDSMVDNLLLIDRDYKIVKANLAARINAGRDIIGEPCHDVFHTIGKKCFMHGIDCPVKAVFDTGRPFRTVHEHLEEGNRVFRDIFAYPVRDRHGEITDVVEVMRDVTERKRFEDAIEQRNKELTTLNSISRILSQSLKAEDIFNNVLDKVIGLVGMDGGGIFFLDEMGKELRCKYHRGLSEDFIKATERIRVGEDIPGRVALTGQSVITPDISRDTRSEKSILRHSGIKGYASIPIKGKEKLIGVFYIFSFNSHVFSMEEERILNSISETMGIAFENIRLYEKMRELYNHQRLRRAEEQKNLLTLSSMLSATLDIRSVLASSLSLIKNSCKADFVWLLELDDAGDLLLKTASKEGVAEGTVVYPKRTSSIERYAIEKKKPLILSDIASETKFYRLENLKGYTTACSIPLYTGNKMLGAFTLYYRTPRETKEEDIDFLQTVSSILAVSMERAKLYENAIIEKGMADVILESIADGVMTVDTDGKVISMNRAAENIIGLSPRSAVGSQCRDVLNYTEKNTEVRWKFGECLDAAANGNSMTAEANLVAVDGRFITLMLRSAPIRDQRGNIVGVVYVLRDISGEREIDRMKTDFVKEASHAFRTPLSAMVGMTEMLLNEDVSGDRAKNYISTILSESRRLSNIVSDLLDVTRIESGKEIFKTQEIDFKTFLKDIEKTFEPRIKNKELRFYPKLEEDIKGYKGDEDKLKQLLQNLIDNSLTYSDRGCTVEVNIGRHDGTVRIVVRDNGWGIPAEDLKHIGEKFYRAKNVAETNGTGLGLSLCMDIAKMHGGQLYINSKLGEGTTVTVELPMRGH